jgi:hypothetical protein
MLPTRNYKEPHFLIKYIQFFNHLKSYIIINVSILYSPDKSIKTLTSDSYEIKKQRGMI